MPTIANSERRYGWVAMILHWAMAVVLLMLAGMGFYMVRLPDAGFDVQKVELILFHKQLGVLAFVLVAARFAWRVTQLLPALVDALPPWQKLAARYVHLCFYGVLFALPITGWLMSSAAGIPVTVLGATLPDLIPRDDLLFQRFIVIHRWLGIVLTGLFFLHAGAALGHHYLFRDETLKRMLPFTDDPGRRSPPRRARRRA